MDIILKGSMRWISNLTRAVLVVIPTVRHDQWVCKWLARLSTREYHASIKKFPNCQWSFLSLSIWLVFSRHRKTWPRTVALGDQSDGSDRNVPRYGLAIPSTNSWGKSSGRFTPLLGFSIIQINAPKTELATWTVVAFWPGTSCRDSWISNRVPIHQDV